MLFEGDFPTNNDYLQKGWLCMEKFSVLVQDHPDGIDRLHKRYIQANEELFRKNYLESNLYITVQYEDCMLDFVPITENEYVAISKESGQPCGTFVIKPYQEDQTLEKTIFSVLIADEWDIRKILPVIQQKKWMQIYLVLNQAAAKFASFFKLNDFTAMLPSNIKLFTTTEEMRRYFMSHHGAYLPREIIAPEPKQYQDLFRDIHDKRIRNGFTSDNVFLSICVPTYNRGELALKSTKTALISDFDAEIEVIVCDNGSTVKAREYREIETIRDSRLRYYRSLQNGGFSYNVLNCLQRANGKFALLISDEDSVVPENMETALNWLSNHLEDVGACIFGGNGTEEWVIHQEKVFEPGVDAVIRAFHMNYITGCCFNLERIKELDLFRRAIEVAENYYFKTYTHCALSTFLAIRFRIVDSNIVLWHFGEDRAQNDDWGLKNGIRKTITPEDRMIQSAEAVRLVKDFFSEQELLEIFFDRMNVCYDLLSLVYKIPEYSNVFKNTYSWTDICTLHYKTCRQLIQELDAKDAAPFVTKMNKTTFYWLVCKRRQRLCTPEENLLSSLQAQVAKYYFDKGTPFEKIDFAGIEEDLKGWVKDFLEKRS